MGDYLSTPNKSKHSSEGANSQVSNSYQNYDDIRMCRLLSALAVCRAGAGPTKIHTFALSILSLVIRCLRFSMAMAALKSPNTAKSTLLMS